MQLNHIISNIEIDYKTKCGKELRKISKFLIDTLPLMKHKYNGLRVTRQIQRKNCPGKKSLKFSSDKNYPAELRPDDVDNFYKRLTVKIFMAIGFPVLLIFYRYHFFYCDYIESVILFLTLLTVLIAFFLWIFPPRPPEKTKMKKKIYRQYVMVIW